MIQALKKLLIVSAILILMGYVGNLVLDNPYVHSLMRASINQQLKEYTHLNVRFEAIGAKFLPPGIDVYGIEVKNTKGDPKTLFKASHAKLQVSLRALLWSRKEILDLEINEPVFELPLPPIEEILRMEKFPDWNKDNGELPVWPPESQQPFYRLAITNGKFGMRLAEDGKESLAIQSEGLDFEFIFHSWQHFQLSADGQGTQVFMNEKHMLRNLDFHLRLHKTAEGISTDYVQLTSPDLETSGRWNIGFELTPRKRNEPARLKGLLFRATQQIKSADMSILGNFLGVEDSDGLVNGKVELQLHVPLDDRPVAWEVEGHGSSSQARLMGFKLLDSTTDFNIREDGMSFENTVVKKGEATLLKGRGFLGFKDEGRIDFELLPQDLPLKDLMSILKVEDFEALETSLAPAKIKLSGQTAPFGLQLEGDLILEQLTFPFVKNLPEKYLEAPTCLLSSLVKIDEKMVEVKQANGTCHSGGVESALQMSGKFQYETAKGMAISLASPDLKGELLSHYTKMDAKGVLDSNVEIKGPYENLLIAGEISSGDFDFSGFRLQDFRTVFRMPIKQNRIEILDFGARIGEEGHIAIADASVGLDGSFPFSASIIAKHVDSSFLADGLKHTIGNSPASFGIKSLEGDIRGEIMKPFAYEGKLHFSLLDLIWENEKILSEATGSFVGGDGKRSLEGTYLKLDKLDAKLDVSIREGQGRGKETGLEHLGLERGSLFKLSLHTLNKVQDQYRSNSIDESSNHLTALPFIGVYMAENNFGGVISFSTELEGQIDELQGKVEGSLERPFVWGIPIASLAFSGFVDGMRLQIPEFRHAGNALLGRLNIDFGKANLPYDAYIYLNQFDVRAVIGKIFADDPRNFAYLSAECTLAGSLKNFWQSRGEIILTQLRSKLFRNLGSRTSSLELNSDQAIRIKIAPEQWGIADKRPLKLKGDFFDLEFSTGDNRLPDSLDLRLQGSVKLDLLKNFSNLAETARGELVLDGYVRGSIAKPEFSMRIRERKMDPFNMKDWNPVSVGLINYGPALAGISLDIEVKSDRLVVHRFKANKGREGKIEIAGVLLFHESSNDVSRLMINLDQIEFNRLAIPVLKSADLIVSGDLTVSGNSVPFNLAGNLKIDRFQSIGSFDLRREIVASLYESKLNSAAASGAGTQALFTLDIGVQADRSIVVKNKSLEGVLSANLRLKGTDNTPLMLGQIIADQGSFNYRRNFKLTQAVISFDEPVSPPNPRLDISGETIINPYKVTVQITGDVGNPKVNLTSDPPSRDDGSPISNLDIVLLITTGKLPDVTNKTAEKASVNEIVSSFLVFAEEPIEKLFDLSGQTVIREVYIDSYISETEQRPVTRLNVPFNIFNSANAVVQVDDESNAKLSFEYPLHEGITLSGSLDKKANKKEDSQLTNLPADTGFDLKFRFGFD